MIYIGFISIRDKFQQISGKQTLKFNILGNKSFGSTPPGLPIDIALAFFAVYLRVGMCQYSCLRKGKFTYIGETIKYLR